MSEGLERLLEERAWLLDIPDGPIRDSEGKVIGFKVTHPHDDSKPMLRWSEVSDATIKGYAEEYLRIMRDA